MVVAALRAICFAARGSALISGEAANADSDDSRIGETGVVGMSLSMLATDDLLSATGVVMARADEELAEEEEAAATIAAAADAVDAAVTSSGILLALFA